VFLILSLEYAAKFRLRLVTGILKRLRTIVLVLQEAIPTQKALLCKFSTSPLADVKQFSTCHSTTLGFIICALGQAELKVIWAEPDLSTDPLTLCPPSVQSLVQKIKKITVVHPLDIGKCNPLPSLIADIESFITCNKSYLADKTLA
jgi:hypothetical protein